MNRKTLALALATMSVVGCTPFGFDLRRNAETIAPLKLGNGTKGQLILPKRCALRLAVLTRPLNDPAINHSLWGIVDEQLIGTEARRRLETNGLRIGIVPGSLPQDVEAILRAPPPHQIEPTQVNIPSGDNTLFALTAAVPRVSLIMNRHERTVGKDYHDVTGFIRLTASHEGPNGVSLRFVPELHFGPVTHRYAADTSTNPFSVQQFVMKEGQEEETLRELAATLTVQPGQVVVVGCRPECERSLGSYLLTEPEANSDRLQQKVLLIWAAQAAPDGMASLGVKPPNPDAPRKGMAEPARDRARPK